MPVSEFIAATAGKGFSTLIAKLAADHATRILAPSKVEQIKTNLTPHIEATFRRCSQIKTLLNPYEPAEFLSIHATQRFKAGNRRLDHYELVEWIRSEKDHIIITGTGGSGKSMFMRYLWLSLFEHSHGRIPLFVELRAINGMSKVEFTTFLYHTLSSGKSAITIKDFNKHLENGDFAVILDGFDELSSDRHDQVQADIMALAQNYPMTKIIVSGRPDDRFASWTSFHVAEVTALLKSDVLELIKKAPFDQTSKEKFGKKIRVEAFYESHRSFLANPLLTSMMLLTFSYNFDIPDRAHLFYDQAFDALYQRHDSHKPGGYKRPFKCNLSEDAFKRLLSYFCLITYFEQKFEFDKNLLLNYLNKAIGIEKVGIDAKCFLDDLTDCVCLLVKDGLTYSFAHRSFQEYFAAYCLAYVTSKNFIDIIKKFSARPNDQAVSLLRDMNPELFREKYIIPMANAFDGQLQTRSRIKSIPLFLGSLSQRFIIRRLGKGSDDFAFLLTGRSDLSEFVGLMWANGAPVKGFDRNYKDIAVAQEMTRLIGKGKLEQIIIDGGESFTFGCVDEMGQFVQLEENVSELSTMFSKSGMYEFMTALLKSSGLYIKQARQASGSASDAMGEIFGG